jgi:hypothetical protein
VGIDTDDAESSFGQVKGQDRHRNRHQVLSPPKGNGVKEDPVVVDVQVPPWVTCGHRSILPLDRAYLIDAPTAMLDPDIKIVFTR